MIEPLDALKDKMVMVAKVLQHQGVIDGYGHITARLPNNRILSTPHMPPGKVAVRDLIVLDADGKKLEGFGEPIGTRMPVAPCYMNAFASSRIHPLGG
jgi:ribulose-5-phosphate 4-epimerase/fuculose-1-phosphate aldolase